MKIINPSFKIINELNWERVLQQIEEVARTCYQSHDKTAHPQMRELMIPLYDEMVKKCPVIFSSVEFSV